MNRVWRTRFGVGLLVLGLLGWLSVHAPLAHAADDGRWQTLKAMLYGERLIGPGDGVISLEAPDRAHDAAIVPIQINAELEQTQERHIKTITLVIDDNPSPVAGVFELTPTSGIANIGTRVRINAYTNVRAIAETADGALHMATKFVKASGGCSAPALKDEEAAAARLGKMKLRHTTGVKLNQPTLAQLLISHPNSTGMQMDQLSRHYIPAHFVRRIVVRYGGEKVLTVKGDISLSEDPSIHFYYVPDRPAELTVEVTDTSDRSFTGRWAVDPQNQSIAAGPQTKTAASN